MVRAAVASEVAPLMWRVVWRVVYAEVPLAATAHGLNYIHDMTPNETRITFRDMDSSPAVEHDIKTHVEKLASHFPDMLGCHVVIEMPHRSHRQAPEFRVLVELEMPGKTLVVSRDHGDTDDRADAHQQIKRAFAAAHRELEKFTDARKGHSRAQA
jgi:ribosome-associated translation inhibitor RaiA